MGLQLEEKGLCSISIHLLEKDGSCCDRQPALSSDPRSQGNEGIRGSMQVSIVLLFPGLISQMPIAEYHMKRIYTWAREYRFGDYNRGSIPLEELMVPLNSNHGSPKELHDVGEQNLKNMMET